MSHRIVGILLTVITVGMMIASTRLGLTYGEEANARALAEHALAFHLTRSTLLPPLLFGLCLAAVGSTFSWRSAILAFAIAEGIIFLSILPMLFIPDTMTVKKAKALVEFSTSLGQGVSAMVFLIALLKQRRGRMDQDA